MKLTVDELLKNYLQYVGKSVFVYMPEVITSDEYWGTRPAQKKEIVITKVCVNARGVVIMDSHSEEYPLWIFEVYTTENEVDACDVQNKEEDIKGAYKKLEEQKQIAENWREKYNKQVELETKIEFEMPPIFQQCKEDLAKDWTETDIRRREIMKEKRRELPWKEFRKAYSYNQEQEYGKTDEEFMRINLRDAELFIVDLYNRVKAITGEVTDWKNIHYGGKALNGYVVGKDGTAKVETILAGGYNIQRLHMRVLVNKLN